ncbi:MAG TPA: response regulator [Trichormus sp. M33_DOE_039]|nr:response regulator [Trichormus sp. M33_DOE_039]
MNNSLDNSILIVDDIPTNIKLLFEILHQTEFNVSVAKDGITALKKAEETLPNLILLDVMMPGIDGFETCRLLKENPKTKNIPVIFMTARSDLVDRVKGLTIGAVDYITKPIQYEEVLAKISIHLELRRTQLKLSHAAKMSSLGQLTSGIAHEINKPINFIFDNITSVHNYVKDLLELLTIYEQYNQNKYIEIQDYINKIEIDVIKKNLPQLLSSMQIETEQVEKIVRSLQLFSSLDDTEFQHFKINEGLDSTLILLSNRIKATSKRVEIHIVKNYGYLPFVECYPGQMNQVFMNLLTHAIDSLEEPPLSSRIYKNPTIEICTDVTENQKSVLITIADNGIGIAEEIQQKIFDQFFVTKTLEKGTYFGLAIAHEIITNNHRGTLELKSSPGEGSRFLITIPIEQTISKVS